jgi:hypothetical protein
MRNLIFTLLYSIGMNAFVTIAYFIHLKILDHKQKYTHSNIIEEKREILKMNWLIFLAIFTIVPFYAYFRYGLWR